MDQKDISAYEALLTIDNQEHNYKAREGYTKAYTLSILLPPAGIYYFFKYLFFGDRSQKDIRAGFISLILTTISFVVSLWFFQVLFDQAIPPEKRAVVNELLTPANQKELIDMLR